MAFCVEPKQVLILLSFSSTTNIQKTSIPENKNLGDCNFIPLGRYEANSGIGLLFLKALLFSSGCWNDAFQFQQ